MKQLGEDSYKKAVYAGSFDPLTLGHYDIIERASGLFDSVTVLISNNTAKSYMLDIMTRLDLVKKSVLDLDNVNADFTEGLVADYIRENDINIYIRGIRNVQDYLLESQLFGMNKTLIDDSCEMIYLFAKPEFSHINSSMVREINLLGGDISPFVPENVNQYLKCNK